ncbi:NUDIX hydrolase, partial [Georgenia sp. 10Sc9-8]|nr:NUDIX hydrolase [Georgenia halotolerans]
LWSHHGGTWGLPGGALADGESPVAGAVREAVEEAGVPPEVLRVHATRVLEHPDWAYTTVVAEAVHDFEPDTTDHESLEVGWVPLAGLTDRELLPAFADALPELRDMVRRLVLVVDAANVVGSRPDGWWHDRQEATTRLRDHLTDVATDGLPGGVVGLPGDRWFPEVVMVSEGAARGVPPTDGVHVVEAAGSGDDEIVAQVERVAGQDRPGPAHVVVATADRGLIGRVRALGATVVGPRSLGY